MENWLLIARCKLCLPLARQHTTRPFSASHISGRNQIDYILVSQSLLPAVQRSGVLSHHSLIRGDHRPYYLDFDPSILFSNFAYKIEPASIRKLRLQDPRLAKQYLHELLAQHNVFPRLEKLQDSLTNQEWIRDSQAEYELLDRTITESMLTAEAKLSTQITTTYQWSPVLKQAVQQLRYWNLRLRQVRGQPFSELQLQKFQQEGVISPSAVAYTTETAIKKAQHDAYS